jgi:hypothetical protein
MRLPWGVPPPTTLVDYSPVNVCKKKNEENLPTVLTSRHRLKQIGFLPLLEKEVRIRI